MILAENTSCRRVALSLSMMLQGCRPRRVSGVPRHPQILADQLILSQAGGGGQIMPTTLLLAPLDLPTALYCLDESAQKAVYNIRRPRRSLRIKNNV